jgi:hypothetical protein
LGNGYGLSTGDGMQKCEIDRGYPYQIVGIILVMAGIVFIASGFLFPITILVGKAS